MLKKGLSRIVVNLLIILLILVVVGIIWFVVKNNLQSGSEQNKNTIQNSFLEDVNNIKDDSTLTNNSGACENEHLITQDSFELGNCLCNYDAFDCGYFKTRAEAQTCFEECGGINNNVNNLEVNNNGSVCTTYNYPNQKVDESQMRGFCVCDWKEYTCDDFSSRKAAQICFEGCGGKEGSMKYLDGDNDCLVCDHIGEDIISNTSETNEQVSLINSTLDLAISKVQIINDSKLIVTVKRYQGEDEEYFFTGIRFIIDDGDNKEMFRGNYSLPELGAISIQLSLASLTSSKIKEISIFPILVDNSGKEFVGSVQDVYVLPTGSKKIEQKGTGEECIQANIVATKVVCSNTDCNITLIRQSGNDEIKGVKLLFADNEETTSSVFKLPGNIIDSEITTLIALVPGLPKPNKVTVVPYFQGIFGNDKLCKGSSQLSF